MNVHLVIPAWGRYPVTRLCLEQKRHLAEELAPAGIQVHVVVVADDGNHHIARALGFDALRAPNVLGRRVNDGLEHAHANGADWVAFCGSDDWIHPSVVTEICPGDDFIHAGHEITVVDLATARLRELGERGPKGVSPWFIPRAALERAGVRLIDDSRTRGMEGLLSRALQHCDWVMHDPHPHARVDFKTRNNMTAYDTVAKTLGHGDELHGADVWAALSRYYPAGLVEQAADLAGHPTA